jgi:VIT1/CCC1 family predicted Fe2+/Mn2+ transporter
VYSTTVSATPRRAVAAAVLGGALTCVGAMLPWLTLFAGLQSYSGLVGLYGRLVLAAGVLATVGGVVMTTRSDRWLRRTLGGLGIALTLFVVWLLVGLRSTTGDLRHHAMLLARPGPGLFVALVGAILIASCGLPTE